ENLEWNSISQNLRHAYSSGIACLKGSKNPRSILTETDVRDIKNKLNTMSVKSVADIYKVTPGTIYNIISGRSWKHVMKEGIRMSKEQLGAIIKISPYSI